MKQLRVGFALCGSFCTLSKAIAEMRELKAKGADILPIMSANAYSVDTRFGKAEKIVREIEDICGKPVIHTITDAEPLGPKKMIDILIIEPCTGNTLAKLANGINDTPVTLAAKSHIRNGGAVLLAVSTNDALGAAAARQYRQTAQHKAYIFRPDAPGRSYKKAKFHCRRFFKNLRCSRYRALGRAA